MAVLSQTPDTRAQRAEVGRLIKLALAWALFAVGWLIAKTLRGVATAIAAVLFTVGYLTGRIVWPALCWSGRAVRLGWEQGRKPGLRG